MSFQIKQNHISAVYQIKIQRKSFITRSREMKDPLLFSSKALDKRYFILRFFFSSINDWIAVF